MLGFLKGWKRDARRSADAGPIPSASCPIVHLAGPGHLRLDNNRLAYDAGFESQDRVPQIFLDIDSIQHLCCYGRVQISVEAMHALLEKNVNVALLSANGAEFLGRLTSEHGQRPLDRVIQSMVFSKPEFRLELAKALVDAKIRSQIGAARHYQRHGVSLAAEYLDRLKSILEDVKKTRSVESLRGFEGLGSSLWFELFAKLLRKPFTFEKRVRRPPTEPVNALLSLGYTLLTNRTASRLAALGYEVSLGCLHEFRSGRPSLACDHVEPLRVGAVDRWVVAMVNEKQVSLDDFETPDRDGGVLLKKEVFPKALASWELHWRESLMSEILDRQIMEFRDQVREFRPKLPTLLRDLENADGWAEA